MEASHPPKTPPPGAPVPPAPAPGPGDAPADRRTRVERRLADRRKRQQSVAEERRAQPDRRTNERRAPRNINAYDLGADELELINAVNAHKARTGRAFPTWSEMLKIVRALGYEKRR